MKRHFKRRRLIVIADAMNVVKDVDYIFDNFVGGGNWWQWKITLVSFCSIQSDTLVLLVFKNCHPWSLFRFFGLFQTNNANFTTNSYEECPLSIHHQDSNSRPSNYESPILTTRPGRLCNPSLLRPASVQSECSIIVLLQC